MDFLKEVKTTKKVQNNIEKFESLSLKDTRSRSRSNSIPQKPIIEVDKENEPPPLLTAVSTKSIKKEEPDPKPASKSTAQHQRKDSAIFLQKDYLKKDAAPPSLADDAREILKYQPGIEDIEAVLAYVQYGIEGQHEFNIMVTGPKSSQLTRVLVTNTLPDLWPNLTISKLGVTARRMKQTLLAAFFSITGIEAILEQVRTLTRPGAKSNKDLLGIYVDFLGHLLHGSKIVTRLLQDMPQLYEKEVQRRLFWQAVVSLLAGSKILSTMAAVPNVVAETESTINMPVWLTSGEEYTKWLAGNIVTAATELGPNDHQPWSNLSQLFKRGLSLGYRDVLATKVYRSLLLDSKALWTPLHQLIKDLPSHDQKVVFDCILNDLSRTYLAGFQHLAVSTTDSAATKAIAGCAALVRGLVMHNDYLLECAIDWVSSTASGAHARGSGMRRALISVLAQSEVNLERILERTLTSFSDKLQIQHAATAQQEHLAQIILLVIGYLHRQHPASLKKDPIPSLTMNAVSNRLTSSIPRTRLLGMIVGVGMSQCVDQPGKVMDFHVEEMETEEVKEMLALTRVQDSIGETTLLETVTAAPQHEARASKKRKITTTKPSQPERGKVMSIEEVETSSGDEDDLVPYQKPMDDPEDSDEDPTLINRNKPKAPIYIVDLIKQLQSASDKLDVISLALKTAPSLIRRKAGFGTELSDNVYGLASALINLQDGMSKSEHQQQRMDALIACLVSQPEKMGKYLASTYFEGDFSLSQRSTLLITIGLGARELAGFSDGQTQLAIDMFPSQRLAPHMQPKPLTGPEQRKLTGTSNPITMLTNAATQSVIRPMAQAAASSQEGPEILKVTRTSSRLSVAREKSSRPQTVPRNVHGILANSIYLPLASPLAAILAYANSNSVNSSLLHPSIVALHLQTLTLLLHTLGPTGLSPPGTFSSIVHETMALLTALHHNRLSLDGVVLPALLGLILALIDTTSEIGVTAQERLLADPFGMAVSELVTWVSGLEGNGRAPPPMKEDERGAEGVAWTVLAAGIQVKWYEMGRKFQGRMLGLSLDD